MTRNSSGSISARGSDTVTVGPHSSGKRLVYMSVSRTMVFFSGVVALFVLLGQPSFAQKATAPKPQAKSKRVLPTPVIAVVDFKKAVRESNAGQSILKQINARHAKFQKEIQKMTNQLEKSRQELARQQNILAPDVFAQKRQEFQTKAAQYQRTVQAAQRKLDIMLNHSMRQVEVKLAQVVATIANELGANLVIDAGQGRGDVLFTHPDLLITEAAKERLNKLLPDVKVVEPTMKPAPGAAQKPRLQVAPAK